MTFETSAATFVKASKATTQARKVALSNTVVVEALTGWQGTEVTEYTEGSSEAVGRRVTWIFPNRYAVVVGTDFLPTISYMDEDLQIVDGSPFPFPESIEESNWSYAKYANGWVRNEDLTAAELAEFLENIEAEVGKPRLILPWESRLDSISWEEDPMEYWRGGDNEPLYQAYVDMILCFSEDRIEATKKLIPWDVEIAYEDDYMPELSDYVRFINLADSMSEDEGWFVNLDEHCAACSSGTRKSELESNPALKDKPEFMTWGQNSQGAYYGDGKIFISVNIYDEDGEKVVKKKARDFGFDLGDYGKDFTAEEELWFSSEE